MLQLTNQATEQTLYVTRTEATPTGVTSYKLSLTSRGTNQTTVGVLELSSEDARKLIFTIFVNVVVELNNIDLLTPEEIAGFYTYEIIAVTGSGDEVINSGLLFYNLTGVEAIGAYETYGEELTFKGYEGFTSNVAPFFLITDLDEPLVTNDGDNINYK